MTMSITEIKKAFRHIIEENSGLDPYQSRRIFSETIRQFQNRQKWQEDRRGMSWADDELRVVLSDAPTRENCLKHARAFQRGYARLSRYTDGPGLRTRRLSASDPMMSLSHRSSGSHINSVGGHDHHPRD